MWDNDPISKPHRRAPSRLGDLLKPSLDRVGAGAAVEQARVHKAWTQAAGAEVARHARAGRLRQGVLDVWVEADTWATELRFLAPTIIESLQAVLGASAVRELSVRKARPAR